MYFMYSEATVIEAKKVATHPATTLRHPCNHPCNHPSAPPLHALGTHPIRAPAAGDRRAYGWLTLTLT